MELPWHLGYLSTALLILLSILLRSIWRSGSRRPDMFPGPPTSPIFGNLRQIAANTRPMFMQLYALHQQYGPYLSLKFGSKTTIVLGDDGTSVRELFDKRGAIYSNRITHIFGTALRGPHLLQERNHEIWRTSRKLLLRYFSPNIVESKHVRIQEAESTQLLLDLSRRPEGIMKHPIRYVASILTSITYGFRTPEYEHPGCKGVADLRIARNNFSKPALTVYLDAFPWLRYFPDFMMGRWRDFALSNRKMTDNLYNSLAQLGRDRTEKGLNTDSLLNILHAEMSEHGLSEDRVHYLPGIILEGGSEILGVVIITAILALIAHPELQRKAQKEIDSVCDEDHLPTWKEHRDKVPYIHMIAKETLRWRPPLPLGVEHSLDGDDTWRKWFIPEDSAVLCNIWAIHMNPDRYPNPAQFIPERFNSHPLSMVEYQRHANPLMRDHFAFGSGRRVCPGIQLADQALFIALSRILWAFDLSVPDGYQLDTDQDTAFVGFGLRRPKDFPLVVTPRSEKRLEAIEREERLARENLFSQFG